MKWPRSRRYGAPTGTGPFQANFNDGVAVNGYLASAALGQTWTYFTKSYQLSGGAVAIGCYPADGRDLGVPGIGAGPRDEVVDFIQSEAGKYATSFIGTGTRAADIATIPATAIVSGRLSIELDFYPLGSSSQYDADQIIAWADASNFVSIVQSSRQLQVTLGGSSILLPVTLPANAAFDSIAIFVESGADVATHAWIEVNGVVTDLGSGPVQANWPAVPVHIMGTSTVCSFSSVVARVRAYA